MDFFSQDPLEGVDHPNDRALVDVLQGAGVGGGPEIKDGINQQRVYTRDAVFIPINSDVPHQNATLHLLLKASLFPTAPQSLPDLSITDP